MINKGAKFLKKDCVMSRDMNEINNDLRLLTLALEEAKKPLPEVTTFSKDEMDRIRMILERCLTAYRDYQSTFINVTASVDFQIAKGLTGALLQMEIDSRDALSFIRQIETRVNAKKLVLPELPEDKQRPLPGSRLPKTGEDLSLG